jgi:hypothetical protein
MGGVEPEVCEQASACDAMERANPTSAPAAQDLSGLGAV